MELLTQWFTAKPVHDGVYQRDHFGYVEYSRWTGAVWLFGRKTAAEANSQILVSRFQDLPWRGTHAGQ